MSTQVQRYQQARAPAQQEPKKFDVVRPEVPGIPPEVASQIITGFRSEDGTVRAYVLEAGLLLKLEQIARKKGGLRLNVVIPVSLADEDPDQMLALFDRMPEPLREKMLQQRDYEFAMFTTPKGTALFKAVLLFGDGTKVWDYGEASVANVKMSTLHGHLNHLAATRARLRTIRKVTARGFLTPDQVCANDEAIDEAAEAAEEAMLEADLAAVQEGLAGAGDADLPFRVEDAPAPEPAGLEPGGGGGQAQPGPVEAPAPSPGPVVAGAAGGHGQVAGDLRPESRPAANGRKPGRFEQQYLAGIRAEARKRGLDDAALERVASQALGRPVTMWDLEQMVGMELAAVYQAVTGVGCRAAR